MLVSIAYRVMHAPWSDRQQWLAAIMARVPTARVIRDERRDLWDTARRAWLDGASSGATHVMVLQDDMIPVDDFETQMLALVAEKPEAAISVFAIPAVGWAQEDSYGRDKLPGWRNCGPYFWGGSVCLPAGRVRHMVDVCDMMSRLSDKLPDRMIDDARISRWAAGCGIECAHWYPQLIDHVGSHASLIGNPAAQWRKGVM